MSRGSPARVLCCSTHRGPKWKWVSHHFSPEEIEWTFLNSDFSQRSLFLTSWQAHQMARKGDVDLIAVHGPHLATRIGLLAKVQPHSVPIICYSFHHDHVPRPFKARLIGSCLRPIDRFVVYSTKEIPSYHRIFGIPEEHIQMLHWGISAPSLPSSSPLIHSRYVCSVGKSSRDYATLFEAASKVPDIPFVVVTDPNSLMGLETPPNVSVRYNIPLDDVDNLLHNSQVAVLPLQLGESACGHGIVVRTMFLARPLVVTECEALADYTSDQTARTYPPKDADALAKEIRELWEDPEASKSLSQNALNFVQSHCTEASVARHFRQYLEEKKLLKKEPSPPRREGPLRAST